MRLKAANDLAVVEVEDTGLGIPQDEQQQLFERFFRSSRATQNAIPGTGLGLTITKAIVERHRRPDRAGERRERRHARPGRAPAHLRAGSVNRRAKLAA